MHLLSEDDGVIEVSVAFIENKVQDIEQLEQNIKIRLTDVILHS